MKKFLKIFLQYITVFFIVFILLLVSLLTTAKIPRTSIEKNLIKSTDYFRNRNMVEIIQIRREYTYLHLWSESVLLNIINCIDTDHVFESTMIDRYYMSKMENTNKEFIDVVEQNLEPNTQYLRYWHGSMIFIRPLLLILPIQEIFSLNYVIINIFFIVTFIILLKKNRKLGLIFVIGMFMVAFPVVGISLLYSWTFYIMMIMTIIAIFIEKKGNSGLYKLLFVSGMITCFLDFLTTELITLYVPVLIVLYIRKVENKEFKFKDGFKFVVIASITWAFGYASMWIAKWLLASIVLKENALKYVIDNIKLRINGTDNYLKIEELYKKVIPMNFYTLYPLCNIKGKKRQLKLLIRIIIVFVLLIDWKNLRKNKFSLLMLIIAIIPYARYLILANHSFKHYFFTFREQIITIIALGFFIIDSFNSRLWLKEIKIKKDKKEEV